MTKLRSFLITKESYDKLTITILLSLVVKLTSLNLHRTAMAHFYVLFRRQQQISNSFLQMDDITEDELENLRQTYDRTYDNLTTNRKIFL